jgi:KDO2-lipid IV(A) lauroyltransferase
MRAILYYLSLPFLYLVSLLPFSLLYGFSDFCCFLFRDVTKYRKGVILTNLRRSFPEKTEQEIQEIATKYYSFMCDVFVETFKMLTITEKEMLQRCGVSKEAYLVFDSMYQKKANFIVVMGHFGNWEWGSHRYTLLHKNQLYAIYHPLQNKYFDGLIKRMRSRFGTKLISMEETYRQMLSYRKTVSATAFIADQTPPPDHAYWTRFMNQETPIFLGTEKIAKKMNLPVVYASVNRIKRGHYVIEAELLVENSGQTADGEISELHTKRLEKDIVRQPETWLWSHRRWKHKKPA